MFLIRLRSLPRKKVLAVLNDNGHKIEREGARHTIFYKRDEMGKVVGVTFVGRHNEIILPELQWIMRQTGKPREEFL